MSQHHQCPATVRSDAAHRVGYRAEQLAESKRVLVRGPSSGAYRSDLVLCSPSPGSQLTSAPAESR